jgi:ubiquinone/menaquinone biosynthesis C-methylase UbiE
MKESRNNHWSQFWAHGHMTSLPRSLENNYEGEFAQFWAQQFSALGEGSAILDVCSGNGAIALLAARHSRSRSKKLQIMATDAADISPEALKAHRPEWAATLDLIRFIPNTRLETLTLLEDSVDLCVSQFGFEYSDWSKTSDVLYRLVRSGGCFAMICHAQDSSLARTVEKNLSELDTVCQLVAFADQDKLATDPQARRNFLFHLKDAVDEINRLFLIDRQSSLLADSGMLLEKILKRCVIDFSTGMQQFVQFRSDSEMSRGTVADLASVIDRFRAQDCWYQPLIDSGFELTFKGEICFLENEKAGDALVFSKPK